ncbi:phage tail protein [Spiribacter halobius]|uniref:Uncharacterized protein n=1 Tax=Sediminicurvatus halobius TaxID=2182432 RepID=A0A2U2MXP0_9GAMM|nr:phage tail protein [Spiribacter halobius]PWG61771.1 hypothetical protein DEM34_15000 [Spiribacter halobius]UEX76795.1 phage tail protein [Spiribacter halobius]
MSTVRVKGLKQVARRFDRTERQTRRAAKLAINDTVRKMRTLGSREIRKQVALKASYVKKHLNVQLATERSLFGRVYATRRPVLLSRFGAKQLTRKASGAAGDPSRSIPAGRKQAGVSVRVKAGGSRKKMRGAFFIRLKRGPYRGEGATGLAIRTGPGRDAIDVKHGPSVDQVWRDVRDNIQPQADENLAREMRRQLRRLT